MFSAGLILGIALSRRVPEGRPLVFFFSFSFGLLFGTLTLHAGLQWLGIDLSWLALFPYLCTLMSQWGDLSCLNLSQFVYPTGLLLWPRNGAATQSGSVWIQPRSPPSPETAGPSWAWDWPSTGSLEDGLCLGPRGRCPWLCRPWGCTTSTVCLCQCGHRASSMAWSSSNLSWCLRLSWCMCLDWFTFSQTKKRRTRHECFWFIMGDFFPGRFTEKHFK